jgi:hypothetical protein
LKPVQGEQPTDSVGIGFVSQQNYPASDGLEIRESLIKSRIAAWREADIQQKPMACR